MNVSLLVFVKELRDEVNVAVELSYREQHMEEYQGEPFQDGMHHEIFALLTESALLSGECRECVCDTDLSIRLKPFG